MEKAMIPPLCCDGYEGAGKVPSADPSCRLSLRILPRWMSTELEEIEPRERQKKAPEKRLPVMYFPPFVIFPRISVIESPG
jgi:hypothetical protein